jgi:hypothetical protein
VGWMVLWLVSCASHDDVVDAEKCARLRAHVVDVRVADLGKLKDQAGAPVDVAAHRAALERSLGDGFVAECLRTVTATQMKCALAANSSESAAACTAH